uniref:Uncharacterized protein n=1 Tax=Oreochromis niloticus TaxID=8128 RepID=A0A669EDY9_ORENI
MCTTLFAGSLFYEGLSKRLNEQSKRCHAITKFSPTRMVILFPFALLMMCCGNTRRYLQVMLYNTGRFISRVFVFPTPNCQNKQKRGFNQNMNYWLCLSRKKKIL